MNRGIGWRLSRDCRLTGTERRLAAGASMINDVNALRAPGAVEAALSAGRDMLFDIDWQGTQQLRGAVPDDLVTVFVLPPAQSRHRARLRIFTPAQELAFAGPLVTAGGSGVVDLAEKSIAFRIEPRLNRAAARNLPRILDVSLRGTLYMSQAVLPTLRAQQSGLAYVDMRYKDGFAVRERAPSEMPSETAASAADHNQQ